MSTAPRSILITGHTGFVGRHLAPLCHERIPMRASSAWRMCPATIRTACITCGHCSQTSRTGHACAPRWKRRGRISSSTWPVRPPSESPGSGRT